MEVTTGKTYVVSGAACTITDDATGKVICTHAGEGSQSVFVACGPSITASSEDVKIVSPFKGAATAGLGGGGSLTADQRTAIENAVGGMLEDVATKPREATKATGWISSTVWGEMEFGAELFQINGTPFYNHGSTNAATLADAINETLGGLVTAVAYDNNKISLESHNVGSHANTITLSTTNPNVFLSDDTLTGGEDEILPSAKLFVDNEGVRITNVPEGSILYTGGMKIATQGGDIYHDDGSATFSGSEGGNNYSAVIDFKHFEVRKDGELIVHFHESNGEPVLELGGERVLTEAYDLRRMEQQAFSNVTSYVDLDVLKHVVAGNSVEYIFPRMPLSSVQTANGVFVLAANGRPSKITSGNTGASVVRIAFNSWPSVNSFQYAPVDPACEFEFFGTAINIQIHNRDAEILKARKVTVTELGTTVHALAADFAGYARTRPVVGMVFNQHIELSAPKATTVAATAINGRYIGEAIGSGNRIANMKISLPSVGTSFMFYGPTFNTGGDMLLGFKIHKQVLIDLFGSLPTPNAGATITTCCDGADAHVGDDGTLVIDDAELASAVDAVQAKGWTLNITPVNV